MTLWEERRSFCPEKEANLLDIDKLQHLLSEIQLWIFLVLEPKDRDWSIGDDHKGLIQLAGRGHASAKES